MSSRFRAGFKNYQLTFSMVVPQQHVGFCVPLHVAGALLVTVTSQPQSSLVHL